MQACVARVIHEAGQIDVLVNNAGYDPALHSGWRTAAHDHRQAAI